MIFFIDVMVCDIGSLFFSHRYVIVMVSFWQRKSPTAFSAFFHCLPVEGDKTDTSDSLEMATLHAVV